VKTSELIKLLKKNNVKFVSHGASHDKYYSPINNKIVIVPRHKKEIPNGTAQAIIKQAGINQKEA